LVNNRLLTIEQVGKLYGKNYKQVLYAIEKGVLKAEKVGWAWIIREEHLPDEWPPRSKRGGVTDKAASN